MPGRSPVLLRFGIKSVKANHEPFCLLELVYHDEEIDHQTAFEILVSRRYLWEIAIVLFDELRKSEKLQTDRDS